MRNWYVRQYNNRKDNFASYKTAMLIPRSDLSKSRRSYPHHTIRLGRCVSVVTTTSDNDWRVIIEAADEGTTLILYYAVLGVIHAAAEYLWFVVRKKAREPADNPSKGRRFR